MGALELYPLAADDPPRIGGFWLDARVAAYESGVGFLAHSTAARANGRSDVIVVQLNDGASRDAAARDRFAGMVNELHIDEVIARGGNGQGEGRLGRRFVDDPADTPAGAVPLPPAPWVALAADGTDAPVRVTNELLREVQLADVAPLGQPSGPDYELPWIKRVGPGLTRIWPLPWPGRFDRAGFATIAVSWVLMLLIAALGVFIAIQLFQNEPPQTPPPVITPTADGSGSGNPEESPGEGTPATPLPPVSPPPPTGTEGATPSGTVPVPTPAPTDAPTTAPSGSASGSASPGGGDPSVPGAPTTRSRL